MDIWQILCYGSSIIVYLNTLNGGFVYDDRRAILQNQDANSDNRLDNNPISDPLWRNDFWGIPLASDNSHGSYRPLCVLTFRLNHWLSNRQYIQNNEHGGFFYHLTNILLHALATGLTLRLGRTILPAAAANLSGLLFAVHPIHTEAVSNIVGRADVLACVFSLSSIICYLRHRRYRDYYYYDRHQNRSTETEENRNLFLTILFGASAALSKETGFSALPICCLYETTLIFYGNNHHGGNMKKKKKTRWKTLKLLGVCTLLLALFRLKISGGRIPQFSAADNPTAKSDSVLTRFLTFSYLPVFNFFLLMYPFGLSYDWSMDSISVIRSFRDVRNVFSLIFYIGLFSLAYVGIDKMLKPHISSIPTKEATTTSNSINKRPSPLADTCSSSSSSSSYHSSGHCDDSDNSSGGLLLVLILLIVPFLPATNLLFYVGFVVAERILYMPSVGYCLLIGFSWRKLREKKYVFLTNLLFGLTIMLFAIRTVLRNEDWNNEEKLYRSGVPINPAKSYGNLGCILSNEGRIQEAEKAFRAALQHRFNMADVHYNLALLLEKTGKSEEAVNSYRLSIRFRHNFAVAYLKLGQLLSYMNQSDEAVMILTQCSKLTTDGLKDPQTQYKAKMEAFLSLGRLYSENGSYGKALTIYEEATAVSFQFNYRPQIFYNLMAETLVKMKRFEEAESLFESMLGIQSTNKENRNKNQTDVDRTFKQFEVFRLKPMPENVGLYLLYAQLLYDRKKFDQSAAVYKTAASIIPNDHQLNVQTAYVCRIAKLWQDAEYFYKRAVSLEPRDGYAYSNLATVLHIQGKVEDSEKAYREALRLQPNDSRTINNYRKLKCSGCRFKYV